LVYVQQTGKLAFATVSVHGVVTYVATIIKTGT